MASTTEQILDGTKFSIKDINIGKPKVNPKTSAKNIALFNAAARCNLRITTPILTCWGINAKDFEGNGNIKYDLSITIPIGEYATPDTDAFLTNLRNLEEHIKTTAATNSKEWFNKPKMSSEVIDALWNPMLKYPKNADKTETDYTRSPSLSIKIPYWDNKFDFDVFDLEGNLLFPSSNSNISPCDIITKGVEVSLVIQSGGIWFANGKFGITWRLSEAAVKPKQKLSRGICHIALSNEQKKAPTIQVDEKDCPEEDEPSNETKIDVKVEDSDEEQVDPDSEYNSAPAETAAADDKKKKGRSKK
jgi:hypothetical protein